jgi:hypothetical protein
MNRLRLERYTPDSAIWKPNEQILEVDPNKSRDLCRFINELSVRDAGGKTGALLVKHFDDDPQIPGGPILRSDKLGTSLGADS